MDSLGASKDSPLDELQRIFKTLDQKYDNCSRLYKAVDSILSDRGVDRLTLAILQQYLFSGQEKSLSWQIQNKRKQINRGLETLKIGVIGEVAAGKTSLVNYFLGNNYLPVDQGVCTKVACEVCNSDFRRVEVHCVDGTYTEKLLEYDPDSKNWKWLSEVIEDGNLYCDSNNSTVVVSSVRIYWPLDLFQDSLLLKVDQECDYESLTEEARAPKKHKVPSVIFVDFPGLDDTDISSNDKCIKRILKDINNDEVDGLLFLIDNSLNNGMNESTIGKVMSQLSDLGRGFDSDKALFICNKWDLVSKKEHKREELQRTTSEKIRTKWPLAQGNQIVPFSCFDKRNENDVIRQIYRFLSTVKRRKLEEYFLWLGDLSEIAIVLMKIGWSWCYTEKVMEEIKEKTRDDKQYLTSIQKYLLSRGKSILADKTDKMKANYKSHLLTKLNKYSAIHITSDQEKCFDTDLKDARAKFRWNFREFKDDVDSWFKNLQQKIVDKSWLLNMFHNHEDSKSDLFDFLIFGFILAFPLLPVIKIGLFVDCIIGEVNEIKQKSFSYRIQREIDNIGPIVEKMTQEFLKQLQKQIDFFDNIENLDICPTSENLVSDLCSILDQMSSIFLQDETLHDIKPNDVHVVGQIHSCVHEVRHTVYGTLARKQIQTSIPSRNGGKELSGSFRSDNLTCQVSSCKKLLLLRKLNKLQTFFRCEHFVRYYGSSIETVNSTIMLHIYMEKCDYNLSDHMLRNNLSYQEKMNICLGAAKAVQFLHEHDIVHRNIKPQNFLVKDGLIKLCDVGHAKDEDGIVSNGSISGSSKYHAPEIRSSKYQRHTAKSDIYSLGLVFGEIWGETEFFSTGTPKVTFKNDIAIPENTKTAIKKVVNACICLKREERPNIQTILKFLHSI